ELPLGRLARAVRPLEGDEETTASCGVGELGVGQLAQSSDCGLAGCARDGGRHVDRDSSGLYWSLPERLYQRPSRSTREPRPTPGRTVGAPLRVERHAWRTHARRLDRSGAARYCSMPRMTLRACLVFSACLLLAVPAHAQRVTA